MPTTSWNLKHRAYIERLKRAGLPTDRIERFIREGLPPGDEGPELTDEDEEILREVWGHVADEYDEEKSEEGE